MIAKTIVVTATIAVSAMFCVRVSSAHQQWGDGSPVSEQVKKQCCGDAEVHFLPPGTVHALADGWHIDGFAKVIPYGRELPTPDGYEWGFWRDNLYDGYKATPRQSEMYCLFLNPRSL
jgi:hypothetical protein